MAEVKDRIESFTADAAYDAGAIYRARSYAWRKGPRSPTRMATGVRRRTLESSARDRTIRRLREVGRRQWKKESGYHRQGTVENAFFRCKSIIGDRLRARHPRAMNVEALIACHILNRMLQLGRPVSHPIDA
ncbi:MAG: hypothetical protein ACI91B_003246 [Planctomycetota bacterium]|jgi:hypothetical protein